MIEPKSTPWRLLASLKTLLWAVLVLCAGMASANRAVEPLNLHQADGLVQGISAEDGCFFLRARWMDPNSGRFVSEDPFEGAPEGPMSLHRFIYANGSPIQSADPSGEFALSLELGALTMRDILSATAQLVYSGVLLKAVYDISKTGIRPLEGYSPVDRRRLNDQANIDRAREEQKQLRLWWDPEIVNANSKGYTILFHYSNREAVQAIYTSQSLFTTRAYKGPTPRAAGAYATDVAPWDLSYTQYELAKVCYWSPARQLDADVSHFAAIRNRGDFINISGTREWYKPGSYPGAVPADISGWGVNMMPGGYP